MSTNFMAERLEIVRKKIDTACQRSGRSRSEVRLIGVAKGQPKERLYEAVQSGLLDIGENYAQEMVNHWGALRLEDVTPKSRAHPVAPLHPIEWHFIGHLQRNKVKQILPLTSVIHSVDSPGLVDEIDKQAGKTGKIQAVLIEVNLGGEESKSGIKIGAHQGTPLQEMVLAMNGYDHISLQGFMTLPPFSEDPEKMRPYFRQLREIRDEINEKRHYKSLLGHLSMGMTNDFEVAIEEGATMVRIGTGIFGPRG